MRTSSAVIQRTTQLARHLHSHSTMATSAPSAAAPWRSTFLSHVKDMEQPNFVLSSLHRSHEPASGTEAQYAPRARTVILRGMWASLDPNPKNLAELNPDVYQSDLLAITSDARMEKVPDMLNTAGDQVKCQSGKGGPVEAVFWVVKTMTQWRFRGHSYVIGPDIDSEEASSVRDALGDYMRKYQEKDGAWSWGRELTAHFGNLSPGMRGSFRNPPPGTARTSQPGEGLGLGQKVEDLHDVIARKNFRVVIIVPEEVDRVDLSDAANGKRWNYSLQGPKGEESWKVTELWP